MENIYTKTTVSAPYFAAYELNGIKMETAAKFNHPRVERRYIKILARCLTYAPADLIYPGVKNPLMKQVRDLCRQGYLDRFEKAGNRKYYYKTTPKGIDLICQATRKSFN